MALQLSHSNGSTSGNYWKIARVDSDHLLNKVYVRLELYEDSAARIAGAAPLCSEQIEYSGSDFSDISTGSVDARAAAYVKVKTFSRTDSIGNVNLDFTGATDV